MKSNVQIVLDELRTGPKHLSELAAALLREGKTANHAIAGQTVRNARKAAYRGATVISLGKGRYALVDCPPEGVRKVDGGWQVRGKTRWQPVPNCQTVEEAAQLRERMKKGGVL